MSTDPEGPRPPLEVLVSIPSGPLRFEGIVRLRLEAPDGSRGVLPGHEPARFAFVPGPAVLTSMEDDAERERYLVTEGGVAQVGPRRILLVTPWAATAETLDELRAHVLERRATRMTAEQRARAIAHRHEMATRRALAGLRREVSQ